VTRSSGENAGNIETRAADLIVGREVREVKDIDGKIDEDQFGAYTDLLSDDKLREQMGIESLRYVFTKPEGAIANLRLFGRALQRDVLRNRLTVEAFDASGTSHLARTSEQAMALLEQLQAKQGNHEACTRRKCRWPGSFFLFDHIANWAEFRDAGCLQVQALVMTISHRCSGALSEPRGAGASRCGEIGSLRRFPRATS